MTKDFPDTVFAGSIGDEVRQSEAGGVSNKKWHVAVVRYNYERICCDMLQKLGYEAYIASQKEMRRYRNRHRREVEKLVISRVVFVRFDEKDYLEILKNCSHVQFFMTDKASTPNAYGRPPIAVVPDAQMKALQYMLRYADGGVEFVENKFHKGDRIRVLRGQLQGFEGSFYRLGNDAYIVAAIDILGSAMVKIPIDDIEKIEDIK